MKIFYSPSVITSQLYIFFLWNSQSHSKLDLPPSLLPFFPPPQHTRRVPSTRRHSHNSPLIPQLHLSSSSFFFFLGSFSGHHRSPSSSSPIWINPVSSCRPILHPVSHCHHRHLHPSFPAPSLFTDRLVFFYIIPFRFRWRRCGVDCAWFKCNHTVRHCIVNFFLQHSCQFVFIKSTGIICHISFTRWSCHDSLWQLSQQDKRVKWVNESTTGQRKQRSRLRVSELCRRVSRAGYSWVRQ